MTAFGLRPATAADSEFCYQLHKSAMGDYVAAIWGWDEQVQRDLHARAFTPGAWQIISCCGADIGMLHVEERPGETYLARIEIDPRYQGRGIGGQIIGELADRAARSGRELALDVLAVNLRARTLYERLGLTEVARHGDGNIKIAMRSGMRRA